MTKPKPKAGKAPLSPLHMRRIENALHLLRLDISDIGTIVDLKSDLAVQCAAVRRLLAENDLLRAQVAKTAEAEPTSRIEQNTLGRFGCEHDWQKMKNTRHAGRHWCPKCGDVST